MSSGTTSRQAPTHGQAKPAISPGTYQRRSLLRVAERAPRAGEEEERRHRQHDPGGPGGLRPARQEGEDRTRPRCAGCGPRRWSRRSRRPGRCPPPPPRSAGSARMSIGESWIGRRQTSSRARASAMKHTTRNGHGAPKPATTVMKRDPRHQQEAAELRSGQHQHPKADERVPADPLARRRQPDQDADQRQRPPGAARPSARPDLPEEGIAGHDEGRREDVVHRDPAHDVAHPVEGHEQRQPAPRCAAAGRGSRRRGR